MIDLELTDEQRVLEQSVREWGAREMAPRIDELDRHTASTPTSCLRWPRSVSWGFACRASMVGRAWIM